jgi:hypothetical protein
MLRSLPTAGVEVLFIVLSQSVVTKASITCVYYYFET